MLLLLPSLRAFLEPLLQDQDAILLINNETCSTINFNTGSLFEDSGNNEMDTTSHA